MQPLNLKTIELEPLLKNINTFFSAFVYFVLKIN